MNKTAKIIAVFAKSWLSYILKGRPMWAIVYVTRKCNLACRYCMFKNDGSSDPRLEDIFIYLDKIKATGCHIISITGGEPTLRTDLPQIIARCKSNRLISYLNTNGHLLTASKVNKLGKAGLDIVNISLDSVSPNINSKKDLQRAIEKIDLLIEGRKKYGYIIISNQVITKDNLHEIHPLIELLKAKGIYVAHGIKYPIADEFKNPSDLRKLSEALLALNRKKSLGYPILTSEKYLNAAIKWAQKPSSWNCLAGEAFLTVDLDGGVLGCDRLPATGIHVRDLTKDNFSTVLSATQKMDQFPKCSKTCMINCAFETSIICASPSILFNDLFQTLRMVIGPARQKSTRRDRGISKEIA